MLVAPAFDAPVGAPFTAIPSSHPVPDERSVGAARAALGLARGMAPGEHLVVLLSGGASALMAMPAPGVSLKAKREVTRRLLRADADIQTINCVRKHLSAVKGGRLAAACAGWTTTLAISDVVGDNPSVIGSGRPSRIRRRFAMRSPCSIGVAGARGSPATSWRGWSAVPGQHG